MCLRPSACGLRLFFLKTGPIARARAASRFCVVLLGGRGSRPSRLGPLGWAQVGVCCWLDGFQAFLDPVSLVHFIGYVFNRSIPTRSAIFAFVFGLWRCAFKADRRFVLMRCTGELESLWRFAVDHGSRYSHDESVWKCAMLFEIRGNDRGFFSGQPVLGVWCSLGNDCDIA